ncbi:MAG: response regulator [Gemmatimonadetes bacterium]|nr:response regulator [Gemmatimonadota bacterium]
MRVLLVDDDPEIRHLVHLALSRGGGHVVECATGGEEALQSVTERRPDAVLLDVLLPDADGVELLERLRRIEGMADVPVVFLTAKSSPADAERLRRSDARGVIDKPFDPLALTGEVERLVGSPTGSGD